MLLFSSLLSITFFFTALSSFHITEDLTDKKLLSVPVKFDDADAQKANVTFKLFIKAEETKGRILTETKINTIILNRNLPSKFFIHGYQSSSNATWYSLLKHQYFRRGPFNIFYVNWSKGASRLYNVSAANVKPVGEFVGDFIIASEIPFDKVHLIGKGLGAMVAGFAGKRVVEKTRKKLFRITGLDPLAPKFEHRKVTKRMRLSEIDAVFVDVIHSDVGGLGFEDSIGHADFYPNGGFMQPDCVVLSEESISKCNHDKAAEYFIESVNYPIYKAKKCDTWKIYLKGLCHRNADAVLGEHTNINAKGNFYYFVMRSPKLT